MTRKAKTLVAVAFATVAIVVAAALTRGMGFSSRTLPSSLEVATMRAARRWVVPRVSRDRVNPVARTDETVHRAKAHWADHCASCHANDGSGATAIGRALYPRAPDMREPDTQHLTDGELFYIIERGVPLTGMPAWGTGTAEGEEESWQLVHFIRHLPKLTAAELTEMEKLNPKSAADIERDRQIDSFLKGKGNR